ncbi:MAG: hypothetical protein U1C12_01720 [Patescibacteria group bacterium]|nr:hypothetical protein [Patescibacteria group bacterium]
MENFEKSPNRNLAHKKWEKFSSRVRLFRFVPFADFVLAAGSLATGQLHEKSDFDVIVGVRQKRIFTARFFAVAFFQLFGWRRSKLDEKETASDKICMNHFVTPRSYRLSPPHNPYWNHLYQNLIPVLGNEKAISNFFKANDWTSPPRLRWAERDSRYLGEGQSLLKKFLEWVLSSRLGDGIEKMLKEDQIKRIKFGLPQSLGYKPRFIYNDDELEFHPDTKRIEKILKELDKDYSNPL